MQILLTGMRASVSLAWSHKHTHYQNDEHAAADSDTCKSSLFDVQVTFHEAARCAGCKPVIAREGTCHCCSVWPSPLHGTLLNKALRLQSAHLNIQAHLEPLRDGGHVFGAVKMKRHKPTMSSTHLISCQSGCCCFFLIETYIFSTGTS